MKIFNPGTKHRSPRHAQLFAYYELLFTLVDFMAAFLFVVGSILFFRESTTYVATWMFLVGSLFFALKPSIRLVREWRMLQLGETEALAERVSE